MRRVVVVMLVAGACGDNTEPDLNSCETYVRPARAYVGCGDPTDPGTLVPCDTGSALAGTWAIDADGLPAYDFIVDERCDEAAHAYSPSPRPIRDPLHVVGDGFGMVAMAHASGGLDVYTQDRGHAWPVHVDTWADDEQTDFPPQLGAAIGYVVDGDSVASTRFEDLPVAFASSQQSRRFGVGYVETTTAIGPLTVTRRVFALPHTRTLVTEITVDNPTAADRALGLVELDDINLYELPVELVTSDLLVPTLTTDIARRRRGLDASFTHHASYDANSRVAAITTVATAPAEGPDDPSLVDDYPPTMWLAPVGDDTPDAAWLADAELWDGASRAPPSRAARGGTAVSRAIDLAGADQPGILAERIAITVPAGGRVVRRFAFGLVPHDGDPVAAATAVRAAIPDGHATAQSWRPRLVWAAFPGQPHAGALQRELAWSSYAAQALATYDSYHQARLLGQGGSYKYIHGIDGAIGDYALFADAMVPIDPALAADTLALSLATQHAPMPGDDPWRFPYATTGMGDFTDMVRYKRRSDAYFLLPSTIARYVALSRDTAFLDRQVSYWPRSAGMTGSVLDHLVHTQEFADTTLGLGAHGIVAMGTNDYADGVLQTATETATETGTSSTFNAGFVVGGFGLAADVVAPRDATLAQRYTALRTDQLAKLDQFAWNGQWYERGFVDNGDPLGHDNLYLEPQVLPIIAGAVDATRRDALLDLVRTRMDTEIGPMTVVPMGANGSTSSTPKAGPPPQDRPILASPRTGRDRSSSGPDQPQVGGVWPVASAWLTEAYAIADPARGWDSLVRNTLFAHAEAFPRLWYGVWSGPDSYYARDADRPGEADAHLATALTDYPVFNVHSHTSVLRALFAVAGIRGTADGIAIAPRFPTETYAIVWPTMSLVSTPSSIRGSLTVAPGSLSLRVRLPSQLRTTTVHAMVDGTEVPVTRDGDDAVLAITAGATSTWSLSAE